MRVKLVYRFVADKLNEIIVVSKAESAYTIMLTSLSQFQAQGWEIGLSQITFTKGTDSLKCPLISINSYPALPLLFPPSIKNPFIEMVR
jgi:hypothetical protein